MSKTLPDNWLEVSLGELAEIVTGGTPKKTEVGNYGGTIPFYKPGDLDQGMNILNTHDTLTEQGLANSRPLPPGSVLVTCIGATIGKTGFISKTGASNQQINSILPNDTFLSKYIYYQVLSNRFQQDILSNSSSTTLPILNKSRFSKLLVTLPPLAEQQRIVAKLDALFGHLEALRTRLDRIPELLKNFRQQVLTQAVTGKLTEEWRKGKGIESWSETSIGEVSKLVTKGSSPKWQGIKYVDNYSKDSILFITSENVDRFAIIESKFKYLEKEFSELQKRSVLEKADVLTNIVGGSIGRTATWNLNLNANINQAVCLIRLDKVKCIPEYLTIYLNSTPGLKSILSDVVDVARANVSLKNVKETRLNLPSIEEQEEIKKTVDSLFEIADRIESKYDALKAKIDTLPHAILTKAFKGELVPQDPNDEPAEVLLERVRAEKANR